MTQIRLEQHRQLTLPALKAACRYFVTNDRAMRSTGALSVVQLSSLL